MREVPIQCIELIKRFEGCELKAYLDAVGVPTIGYGHTKGVALGMVWTQEQAEQTLKDDLEKEYAPSVERLVKVPLTDNQFSALVSFQYNTGALLKATLLKLLNAGEYKKAALELPKWNKARGKVLLGLTRRREAEKELFLREG